jgi:hypothetical protein
MSIASQFINNIVPPLTAQIIVSQSTTVSTPVFLCGLTAVSLVVPPDLQSTLITFEKSYDGTNYYPIRDSISNIDVSVANDGVGAAYDLDARYFIGTPWIRLIMQTAEISNKTFLVGAWSL